MPVRIWGVNGFHSGGEVQAISQPDMENQMCRVVGWLVVTGFALYGASQFARNHIVADKADDRKDGGAATRQG